MAKEDLGKAVSAAADKNYADFADSVKGEIEDKFKDAISVIVNRAKSTMFGGEEPEPEDIEFEEEEESEEEVPEVEETEEEEESEEEESAEEQDEEQEED